MPNQSEILKIKNAFIFFRLLALCVFFTLSPPLFPATRPPEPEELAILRRAYPDILFDCVYDESHKDFKI